MPAAAQALQEHRSQRPVLHPQSLEGLPEIDINTYRLKVDGEVERTLSLAYEDLKKLPQKRFQAAFECCGNSPVPAYYTKSLRISSVMEQIKGHGLLGNAEWAESPCRTCWNRPGSRPRLLR